MIGVTPSHPARTPANQHGATPSYQPTPRAATTPAWPGATPRQTPRQGMGTPSHSSQTPSGGGGRGPSQTPSGGGGRGGTDWAKAAAMWAKQGSNKPSTPRSGQSPRVRQSPMATGGDATPLFDER